MKIISRAEAMKRGLKRYFTGKPCKRGHVAERRVKSRACLVCPREYRAETPEKVREYARSNASKWRLANPKKARENRRRWHVANIEKIREKNKQYKLIGPKCPKGEKQWLAKNQIMLRNLRRLIRKPNHDHSLWLNEGLQP